MGSLKAGLQRAAGWEAGGGVGEAEGMPEVAGFALGSEQAAGFADPVRAALAHFATGDRQR